MILARTFHFHQDKRRKLGILKHENALALFYHICKHREERPRYTTISGVFLTNCGM